MKHKRALLIFFFLVLFLLQQVQVDAQGFPSIEDNLSSNLQTEEWPVKILVVMKEFTPDGWPTDNPCFQGSTVLGCIEPNSGLVYPPSSQYITFPYGGTNPMLVDMENYYLYNVLPREMDVKTYPPTLTTLPALKVQALAARSIADWKAGTDPVYGRYITNVTTKQVFVPGSFEYYNPSATSLIQRAVDETSGEYPSYNGMSIDAEFSNDIDNPTRDGTSWANYLVSVEEPISPFCDLSPAETRGNGWGMSQKGAMRWAKGNQCAGSGNQPWSVQWTDYRQILVHYYTGIDILNGSGGKVAPDDRWNLLKYEGILSSMTPGQQITANIWLQNTSTQPWTDAILGYQWISNDPQVPPSDWVTTMIPNLPNQSNNIPSGSYQQFPVTIIAPTSGTYTTLRFDVKRGNGPWFSTGGWPDARIAVQINGSVVPPTITPAPPTVTPVTTVVPSGNYALSFLSPSASQAIFMPPSATNLNFGTDMTIEFWIRTTDAYGGWAWHEARWILDKDLGGSGQPDWAVVIYNGYILFDNGNPGGGDQPLYSTRTVNDGAWHHIAITRNVSTGGGLTTIYIDGLQDISSILSTANLANTQQLIVGSENGVGGLGSRAFRGDLDELRLWSIPRSQSDLQANMYTHLQGNEAGLAGYWRLDEGTGQIAGDQTQNHYDSQLGDSPNVDAGDPTWILAPEIFGGTPPTPVPTDPGPTPTPVPAPNCGCPLDEIGNECHPAALNGIFHTVSYLQQTIIDLQLLHRVEDEILNQTPQGQHYIDLYYEHGTEIVELLRNNSDFKDEAIATIQLWEPNLQALVDGNGDTVTVTSQQVQAIQTFLDHLYTLGSPELQQTITTEREKASLEQTVGKTMDQAWAQLNSAFPSTVVLDDFNRTNGAIGDNWWGYAMSYNITSNNMYVVQSGWGTHLYWGNQYFGADQEAFVTISHVDADAWEQDLLLKAQVNDNWNEGVIKVKYDVVNGFVQVNTYDPTNGWVQHGANIPVTFDDGDQFGARAKINGDVEVYKNGGLLATRSVTSWPYYAEGGYIGLWFANATDALLDDFGGGNVALSSGLLDDFNRADGSLGVNWSSNLSSYAISSNELNANADGNIFWGIQPFGADQEVYVTLTHIDTAGGEQDLLLKSQSAATWGNGVIEVMYDAINHRVQVWTWEWPGGWVQYGADIPVTFVDGDVFGARALADGTVEVYRNEEILATRDVSSWSHYADDGYVGLWFIDADNAVLDDFGGRTLPGSESLSMSMQRMNTEVEADQLNVEVKDTNLFWQGVPIGQEASVTFTSLPSKTQSVPFKPQSNGIWGDGTIEVLYDVTGERIQVWMYDAGKGWIQYGKDISTKITARDKFSVQVLADGTVQLYRNGKLLAQRDVIP